MVAVAGKLAVVLHVLGQRDVDFDPWDEAQDDVTRRPSREERLGLAMETGQQRQRPRTSDTVFAATAWARPAFEADTERAAPPGPNFIEHRILKMTPPEYGWKPGRTFAHN